MINISIFNYFKKNFISFLLLLALYLSFGLGSLIINSILFCFILFFFFNFKLKNLDFLDLLLIFFGIYIISSSLLNITYFLNSLLFIKFLIFVLSMKLILISFDEKNFKNLTLICSSIIVFIIFDLFYQKIFDVDIFGFKKPNLGGRLSGPFNDKLIPGAIILYVGFYFFLHFYRKLIESDSFINQFLSLFILVIFSSSVLITGERMNFISSLLSIILIFFIINKKKLHIIYAIIAFLIGTIIILKDNNLYPRYENFFLLLKPKLTTQYFHDDEIKAYKDENNIDDQINNVDSIELSFLDTTWGSHYSTAFELFKNKPFFGNGIKSYRDLCGEVDVKSLRKKMRCSTHPHNLHLELLSEIGIIGYLIFLTLIFIVFFEAIKLIINKNKISDESIYVFFAASFILCITLLFPIKSTGRLSSTFFGSLFWFNFAILYASTYILKKKL